MCDLTLSTISGTSSFVKRMMRMVEKGLKMLRVGMICWWTQRTMMKDQGWRLNLILIS